MIRREVRFGSDRRKYRASLTLRQAAKRARRPKPRTVLADPSLRKGRSLESVLKARAEWMSNVIERAQGDALQRDQPCTFAVTEGRFVDKGERARNAATTVR